jgi:hypothetical protein
MFRSQGACSVSEDAKLKEVNLPRKSSASLLIHHSRLWPLCGRIDVFHAFSNNRQTVKQYRISVTENLTLYMTIIIVVLF